MLMKITSKWTLSKSWPMSAGRKNKGEKITNGVYLFICLFIYLLIYLSIYLFIYLFIYLIIYLFIYQIIYFLFKLYHKQAILQMDKIWEFKYL